MTHFDSYRAFFRTATGFAPYPYQRRLAEGHELPDLLTVPTGLGKTAAAVLGWLWRRRCHPEDAVRAATPRRLVFCLPMRVLVEQTRDSVRRWLDRLGLDDHVGVHCLRGGELELDWDLHPERDAVLVGTQDMLLSRALNRGYAMSRFRWPLHFALLSNDALWVLDEVQLMGSGLATSCQLDALRRQMGTFGPVRTLWMSATMQRDWLRTVDLAPRVDRLRGEGLAEEDLSAEGVAARWHARKPVSRLAPEDDGQLGAKGAPAPVADEVLRRHLPGTVTLVIANTVGRAVGLFDALGRKGGGAERLLVHSRFRGAEREVQRRRLVAPAPAGGRIVVATQTVEAGVDLDARLLVTELAPWPSLVQRFGRCNRAGRTPDAAVLWIDLDEAAAAPYEPAELEEARDLLAGLDDAAPVRLPLVRLRHHARMVLRRRDLVELFDTTPDLGGADIDVSGFVREESDRDLRVYWREGAPAEGDRGRPDGDELCPAPIGDLRQWLRGRGKAWRWDHLEGGWRTVTQAELYPGMTLRLDARLGGYHIARGWDPRARTVVPPAAPVGEAPAESVVDDAASVRIWQTLVEHTERVVGALDALLDRLPGLVPVRAQAALRRAARYHDAGKAHPAFQRFLLGDPPEEDPDVLWAKTARDEPRHERRFFRHELASGLFLLQRGAPPLVAYLAAAHHGKVRLVVRSLPGEILPTDPEGRPQPERRFALGVWDGDELPDMDLGQGERAESMALRLSLTEMGRGPDGPGWTARMLALRDDPGLGPFRLAYLEALLRAADRRASEVRR